MESLETLSNFAAMALTALPAERVTGVDRGTVPSVGCAGSGLGPRGEGRSVAGLGVSVSLFVPTFSDRFCAVMLPERARSGRNCPRKPEV